MAAYKKGIYCFYFIDVDQQLKNGSEGTEPRLVWTVNHRTYPHKYIASLYELN